jgi:hypothetical protein
MAGKAAKSSLFFYQKIGAVDRGMVNNSIAEL